MARTNEELNKAIWKVLNTQYKKDAKEAFKLVEENGYKVWKNGSSTWTVNNPHTGKCIHLEHSYYRSKLFYGNYTTQVESFRDSKDFKRVAEKFDFVNCLKTPYNKVYYDMLYSMDNKSKSYDKYDRLKSAKWYLDYETRRIAKIQEDIAKLQAELVRATESKVKDEMKLKEVRKELGLKH